MKVTVGWQGAGSRKSNGSCRRVGTDGGGLAHVNVFRKCSVCAERTSDLNVPSTVSDRQLTLNRACLIHCSSSNVHGQVSVWLKRSLSLSLWMSLS